MNITEKKIAVVGLGYVGLPLAIEFAKLFSVLGFDINIDRVNDLSSCIDRTNEANLDDLKNVLNSSKDDKKGLRFTSDYKDLEKCNVFIVTVPTPIDRFKKPDLQPLIGASEMVGKVLKKGDIVIYESTVYPGCTEEDCVPVLEFNSKLVYNVDFFVATLQKE